MGRVARHASHCSASGALSSVQAAHAHCKSSPPRCFCAARGRSSGGGTAFMAARELAGRELGPGRGGRSRSVRTGPDIAGLGAASMGSSSSVRSMTSTTMECFSACLASFSASAPDAHALPSSARRCAACRSCQPCGHSARSTRTSAASSRRVLPDLSPRVPPPSREPPADERPPTFRRFSAASNALTRATCGGRSCDAPTPRRTPAE